MNAIVGIRRRSKYHARPTVVDGVGFDSGREAERYGELRLMERAGAIKGLEVHPRYPIVVEGLPICTYVADFRYRDGRTGVAVVEDVKGVRTPVYRIKRKLMLAVYGIEIVEVD